MDVGPEQRELFESAATELYEEFVAHAGMRAVEPRIVEGGADHEAFELLRGLGLVRLDQAQQHWLPVDPATVQSRVVAPLGQRGSELIAESAGWARAFGSLAHTWRRSPESVRGPFTEIRGIDSIVPFVAGLVADAEEELLSAQPQHRHGVQQLTETAQRDVAALDRGVRMRTLYQHAARRSTATRTYVHAVTEAGAEVRTLDEFFNRMIVVDRQVVVIPGHQGVEVALIVREPSLVAYLVDVFERTWERARPFDNRENSTLRDIAAEQRSMAVRMLLEGYADPAGAKRMGVSMRTYAGYIADLKAEHDVETRFQLGYQMGRQGISGKELPGGQGPTG